jgi:hypothetical protein
MACPRGYRGRHTGLYRDTEGKQPRARNLRTKFQARRPSRRAAPDGSRTIPPGGSRRFQDHPAWRLETSARGAARARRGHGGERPGYGRSIAGRPPRAQPARLGSFKG